MRQTVWNIQKKQLFNQKTGMALQENGAPFLCDNDFGGIIEADPAYIFEPKNFDEAALFMSFSSEHDLPVTLRTFGLSQSGQSLSISGGCTLLLNQFSSVSYDNDDSVWADSGATWSDILTLTLPNEQCPLVLPYNLHLSVGGVLSAGGMGASSFQFGAIINQVLALEVLLPSGERRVITDKDPLFHSCLGAQGQIAVILRARLSLSPIKKQVRTFYLYTDSWEEYLSLWNQISSSADFVELFATPSIVGTKINDGKRHPFSRWSYVLQATILYDDVPPELSIFENKIIDKCIYIQDTSIKEFLYRHQGRFEMMKQLGQWSMLHPWYECFLPYDAFCSSIPKLLEQAPLFYTNMVLFTPVLPKSRGYLMLPDADKLMAVMVLNPGIHPVLGEAALETIKAFDSLLLPLGGKRYLSGFLGQNLDSVYWKGHFGEKYSSFVADKKRYDPKGILTSMCYEGLLM